MTFKNPFGVEVRYAPPAGYVPPSEESFGPTEWHKLVARGLHFEPFNEPRTVSRSMGNCLWPLLPGWGEHFENRDLGEYLELTPLGPDERLIDGGLYVIRPEDQSALKAAVKEKHGTDSAGTVQICKFLRFACGEWHCVNKDGTFDLGMSTVIYRVVGFFPAVGPDAFKSSTPTTDGSAPRYTNWVLPDETTNIDLNAATSTVVATVASASVSSSASTPSSIISVTVGPFTSAMTVVVTFSGQIGWTYPSAGTAEVTVTYGISTSSTSFSGATIQQTSAPASAYNPSNVMAQEATFSLAANTTQTYYVDAGITPTGIIGTAQTATNLALKAEVIKR